MKNNWHVEYSQIKGDYRTTYGKLKIHKYYNEVCGYRLSVSIVDGDEELLVYGLNDGHRGCGWIHYSEKVENDLRQVLNEKLKLQNRQEELIAERDRKKAEEEKDRIKSILESY